MFNIVTFVFELFCNLQSYSRHIQVWKFLPDYCISTIHFFWAFCWTDFELSYSSYLLVIFFYPFIPLLIMLPISLAISSSILIQHCSDERRLISMASIRTCTESSSWVPIFDFLHTETRDYGKLTHLCTAPGDLLNLGNAVGETEAQWKEQHNEREL